MQKYDKSVGDVTHKIKPRTFIFAQRRERATGLIFTWFSNGVITTHDPADVSTSINYHPDATASHEDTARFEIIER
jgi:hypothetical protein